MTAHDQTPRCWAERTDREHRDTLIVPELRRGILRQGWGYDESQDLRRIRRRLRTGAALEPDERAAWSRNRRLLPDGSDCLRAGDWLLLPNLPTEGRWTIARAGDSYEFAIASSGDHGHMRAVTVLREGVDPRALELPAGLRRTTRCQRALWNIDAFADEIAKLIEGCRGERVSPSGALHAMETLAHAAAWSEIRRHFGGAELEQPIAMLLRRIYSDVEERGGPGENGADLVCRGTDPLGLPVTVAVQVKMWDGIADDPSPFEQLARAAGTLPGLTAAIVLTTASETSPAFDAARQQLEATLRVPVRVLARADVLRLFLSFGPSLTTSPELENPR